MDRAERAGLGVAVAGHAALLAALSLGFASTRLPPPKTVPIEVELVDAVALEELPERLAQLAGSSQEEGGPRIFLRADRALDYGSVMKVMGEISAAGLRRVAMVSTQEGEPG